MFCLKAFLVCLRSLKKKKSPSALSPCGRGHLKGTLCCREIFQKRVTHAQDPRHLTGPWCPGATQRDWSLNVPPPPWPAAAVRADVSWLDGSAVKRTGDRSGVSLSPSLSHALTPLSPSPFLPLSFFIPSGHIRVTQTPLTPICNWARIMTYH